MNTVTPKIYFSEDRYSQSSAFGVVVRSSHLDKIHGCLMIAVVCIYYVNILQIKSFIG